jgi:NADH:ubiquinone oxidoreductase subunit E
LEHTCQCNAAEEFIDLLMAAAPRRKEQLIPLLQSVQSHLGYVPESAMTRIATHLRISPNEVYGVVTFYAQFRLKAQGRHTLKVCQGTACHVRGANRLVEAVKQELNVAPGDTTVDGEYTVERAACFGACGLAPVVMIDEEVHGKLTEDKLKTVLRQRKSARRVTGSATE